MWPLGDKKPKGRGGIPLGNPGMEVRTLSSQGLSEQEIGNKMKEEGYTDSEIDDAMRDSIKTQVSASDRRDFLPPRDKFAVEGQQAPSNPEESVMPPAPRPVEGPAPSAPRPPEPMPPLPPEEGLGPESPEPMQPMPPRTGNAPQPPFDLESFGAMQSPEAPEQTDMPGTPEPYNFSGDEMSLDDLGDKNKSMGIDRDEIEEIVESIVEDKWSLVKGEINSINTSIGNLDSRIASLEETVDDIKKDKKSEVHHIDEKIDTYKGSIEEVSARMEAMESALKNSLTPMMQSMRSLNDTVKTIKEKKK
jgi:flagellar capping protein FliD